MGKDAERRCKKRRGKAEERIVLGRRSGEEAGRRKGEKGESRKTLY